MKATTGLLVGATMLFSSFASAQYFTQASVSGLVLSNGPLGFMLQGPDGNYGIEVGPNTVVTDPWNSLVITGRGGVEPGDYVTAIGYPTDQWIMDATRIVVRNGYPSAYPSYGNYGIGIMPGGVVTTPNTFPLIQQGVTTSSTLTNRVINPFTPMPAPHLSANPFAASTARR